MGVIGETVGGGCGGGGADEPVSRQQTNGCPSLNPH